MSKPSFVYVVYIAATAEKVFAALTDPDMTARYWTGSRVQSDWKVGAPFELKLTRHDKNITGQVLEYDPPRLLVWSWIANWHEDPNHATTVRWELTPTANGTHLRVTHSGLRNEPISRKDYGQGWVGVLQWLQTYLK